MKITSYILLIILSINISAQNNKNIEILNADNTFADSNKHPNYWRLIGNVSFKHNNTIMNCDSAFHYITENKMRAHGKVKIKQGDSISITGKNLRYLAKDNKADIIGDVVLIDKHITLETQEISYNLEKNIISYPKYGKIINNEKIIHSNKGAYHANIHNFVFKDSVIVHGKDYKIITDNMHYNSNSETAHFFGPSSIISDIKEIYCENGWYNTKEDVSQFRDNAYITNNKYTLKGDSLYYNKNKQYARAFSNVMLIDTINKMTIFGEVAEYFEEDEKIIIHENPILELLIDDDTLFMHAKQFVSQQRSDEKKILAYNKVKFFKKNLQGKCDSLSYNFDKSRIEMFTDPILWSNELQLTSDSMQLLIHNNKINQMFLYTNPMIITKENPLEYNQIKGKKMTAYFLENEITRMNIIGNGQSIFIIEDEKTKENIGINYTECSEINLYFNSNKLKDVSYQLAPNSTTIPYEEIQEEDRYLKGFSWREDEQPRQKDDIFE